MGNDGFINRPMAIALDAVRGLAAVMVLLGHAVQIGVYDGPWPFGQRLQHNPVVIFFVLSGLVIATSALRGKGGLLDYTVARVARIMPVALFALAFGSIAYFVGTSLQLDGYHHAVQYRTPTVQTVLFPLFFLSERGNGNGPLWNPPYWSLVYEVWFYALFGAAFYLRGVRRWLVLGALGVLATPKLLVMFPLWLLGALLARFAPDKGLPLPASLAAIVAGGGLWRWCNETPVSLGSMDWAWQREWMLNVGFSQYAITDTGMGLGIMLIFLGMRPFVTALAGVMDRIDRPARWLAGCSFTLYVMHWPLLNLMRGFGWVAGDSLIAFAGLMAAVIAFAAFIARVTEHRRSAVRALLYRWLARAGGKGREPVAGTAG